ncbi:Exported hypothetical protein [Micromonospora lupini str. Lupac 08]|uniref:Uncharacterized protein n=1 Tax=Micromonospora lupini str. Lupac 08 TaxID=1150864 RepID=I0KYE9_9ACTN|nr:Exported hypothetical protein [Micromonospora lupini str. Lupac 08]
MRRSTASPITMTSSSAARPTSQMSSTLPSWLPQNAMTTSASADSTAPMRPDLRCPGLCWSGDVTGSLPATVGPSLAIGSLVSLARLPPGAVRWGFPRLLALPAQAGRHYGRRGVAVRLPPVAFGVHLIVCLRGTVRCE